MSIWDPTADPRDPESYDARNAIQQFNGYDWQGRLLEVREDRFAGPGMGGGRGGFGGGFGRGALRRAQAPLHDDAGGMQGGYAGGGYGGGGGGMQGGMMGGGGGGGRQLYISNLPTPSASAKQPGTER